MNLSAVSLSVRAERFVPLVAGCVSLEAADRSRGIVQNISRSGSCAVFPDDQNGWLPGSHVGDVSISYAGHRITCGSAIVVRSNTTPTGTLVAMQFNAVPSAIDAFLIQNMKSQAPLATEVRGRTQRPAAAKGASGTTIDKFYAKPDRDILAKCTAFQSWTGDMLATKLYQRLYRLTAMGALDHRITVSDPWLNGVREMICFDSNSYLGLHLHPKVIERTIEVMRTNGYGTPSAQLLCGTNRYLCELEDALSQFHGRQATIVFPTGFAANVGTIAALIRRNDALFRDRFAHASLQEGCRSSRAAFNKVFAHNDVRDLERQLKESDERGCDGKLIVTDGVFSMHGRIAPLPELVETARRYNARLLVDDAHGLGVLGRTGGGVEEHFAVPGSIDILMGTLSKALGAIGGYVTGSHELIDYLRFFAPSGIFTTAIPAPICAGLTQALHIVREEHQLRERLWTNINRFAPTLREEGFIVSDPISPIVTVFLGDQGFMFHVSRLLSEAGIKCGSVGYPAVSPRESILRFTLNARHTDQDLDYAITTLTRIGRSYGILHKDANEIRKIGKDAVTSS